MANAVKWVRSSGAVRSAASLARSLAARWKRLGRIERGKRWPLIGAAWGLAVALVVLGAWQLGWLSTAEWLMLDARFLGRYLLEPRPERSPVTVVAIDDRAVAQYGRWPWPRAIQAELIYAILDAEPSGRPRARPRSPGPKSSSSRPTPPWATSTRRWTGTASSGGSPWRCKPAAAR